MTPTKWITQMNAIGIVSKAGRYGGTYAHSDIAICQREYEGCSNIESTVGTGKLRKL